MILALFHGQGCVERGFNVNKDMLQPNLEGMSLTSQRMIASVNYNNQGVDRFSFQSLQ